MPRVARVASESGYYHAIMRGNNKEKIFRTTGSKEKLLKLLKDQESTGLISLVAWCIMDNHVHLVLNAELADMSYAIKRVTIQYAQGYHKVYGTSGHVFQDRFRSEPIDNEKYLMRVIRYVHINPIKAHLVEEPTDYLWSSYSLYLNTELVNRNENLKFVMKHFNNDIQFFKGFHLQQDFENYLDVKEDSDFFNYNISQKIISQVCKEYGVTSEENLRGNQQALLKIVSIMKEECKLSLHKISRLVGVPYSSIYKLVSDNQKEPSLMVIEESSIRS